MSSRRFHIPIPKQPLSPSESVISSANAGKRKRKSRKSKEDDEEVSGKPLKRKVSLFSRFYRIQLCIPCCFFVRFLSSEESFFRFIRLFILCLVTGYLLLASPFLTCFKIPDHIAIVILNHVIIDSILYFGLVLSLLIPYEDRNGNTVRNPIKTATHHIQKNTRLFLIDILISFPLSWLILVFPGVENMSWFRLNRALVLLKVNRLFKEIEKDAVRLNYNPSFFRIFKFLLAAVFLAHIVACIFFLIARSEGKEVSQLWTKSLELVESHTSPSYQYFFSLYFSALTLMGYGGFMPISDIEVIFTAITVLIGIGIYVTIIGAVGSLMMNMGHQETTNRERNEQINKYMVRKFFSEELKELVNTYYNYVWHVKKGLDESMILDDLPIFIKLNISRYLNKNIMEKVPMFKDSSDSFISEILVRLKTRVALPNTYIIREGETGREMFFLSRGEVMVVVGGMVVHTFQPGSFFGEIALLNKVKRTASCIASDFCDLYVLEKIDFEIIMDNFKDEAKEIRQKARERIKLEKKGEENDDEEDENEEKETNEVKEEEDVEKNEDSLSDDDVEIREIREEMEIPIIVITAGDDVEEEDYDDYNLSLSSDDSNESED